jgi:hypothetical protein
MNPRTAGPTDDIPVTRSDSGRPDSTARARGGRNFTIARAATGWSSDPTQTGASAIATVRASPTPSAVT